ncbi:MAG: AraC family transcriptional regulator [Novosphingobium sp.]
MPISGICELETDRRRTRAEPGQIFVVNSEQGASKRWIGQCQQLMIRVDKNALHQVLSSELEHDCRKPLVFSNFDHDPAAGLAFRSLAYSTWQELMLHCELEQWRIARTLERTLLVACLGLLMHNYSEEFRAPVAPAAPYYVRRAEEYIRANLREPIGIDELVAVAGVSSRSLYYGFRRWRKTTPMSYLRNLRLNVAHEELRDAENSGKRVTEIAMNIGYDHLSRFSRDYKQRFGESPSATMRRAS